LLAPPAPRWVGAHWNAGNHAAISGNSSPVGSSRSIRVDLLTQDTSQVDIGTARHQQIEIVHQYTCGTPDLCCCLSLNECIPLLTQIFFAAVTESFTFERRRPVGATVMAG